MPLPFEDRREAGKALEEALLPYRDEHPIVLAVPRGGVVVGDEVARALEAPLDVIVARKLGAPGQPELAIGAVVSGEPPIHVLNEDLVRLLAVPDWYINEEAQHQEEEIRRRLTRFRGDRPALDLSGRTVILVDDGIATGYTLRAAIQAIRRQQPARLVVAVPVAPPETVEALHPEVDALVYLETPSPFYAVGVWYIEFSQVSDDEVAAILAGRTAEVAQRAA
ncbi:MAG: phosphoribosyltransferase [Armatimonadetes bacterium]|nr:phosphoribosyltransferase [Armatimonadota bacterium]